jgi:hypothetical protein
MALTRTAKSCGPDAPTLASSWRRQLRRRRWQTSPVTGESTKETVKTIARGMPGVSGVTVVTNACAFYTTHAAAGASSARHSLRPLMRWAGCYKVNLARMRGEIAKLWLHVIACDKREAFAQGSNATKQSTLSFRGKMDCFANARNDGRHCPGCLKLESELSSRHRRLLVMAFGERKNLDAG